MTTKVNKVVNVVVAGLGGQGVLKASDILAEVAFSSGRDVKKAEVHGMSQRGGSVRTDVRYGLDGALVASPMVAAAEADYLVVLSVDQVDVNKAVLAADGVLITPDDVDLEQLESARSLNVAILAVLSRHLDFSSEQWHAAIAANLPEKLHEMNFNAFDTFAAASTD